MKLNKLPKITKRGKKRKGLGYGSGKGGHTSSRGAKGGKARHKVGLLFEGTKMRKSLIKRLPFQRGKGKFKSIKQKPLTINVEYLNLLPDKSEVDIEMLVKNKIVDKEAQILGVKILGNGKLTKELVVKLPTSKGAKKQIENLGGKVIQ